MLGTELVYFSVDPGRSPCLACWKKTTYDVETSTPGVEAVGIRLSESLPRSNPGIGPVAAFLGSLVAFEALRCLTRYEPPYSAGAKTYVEVAGGCQQRASPGPRTRTARFAGAHASGSRSARQGHERRPAARRSRGAGAAAVAQAGRRRRRRAGGRPGGGDVRRRAPRRCGRHPGTAARRHHRRGRRRRRAARGRAGRRGILRRHPAGAGLRRRGPTGRAGRGGGAAGAAADRAGAAAPLAQGSAAAAARAPPVHTGRLVLLRRGVRVLRGLLRAPAGPVAPGGRRLRPRRQPAQRDRRSAAVVPAGRGARDVAPAGGAVARPRRPLRGRPAPVLPGLRDRPVAALERAAAAALGRLLPMLVFLQVTSMLWQCEVLAHRGRVRPALPAAARGARHLAGRQAPPASRPKRLTATWPRVPVPRVEPPAQWLVLWPQVSR